MPGRRAADPLGRRVRRDQLGVGGLERDELAEQLVVLGVADLRRVLLVVELVRPVDLGGQRGVPRGRRLDVERGGLATSAGSTGGSAMAIEARVPNAPVARTAGLGARIVSGLTAARGARPDVRRRRRAEQGQGDLELLAQDRERPLDAGLPAGGQRPEHRPADQHAAGAERQRDRDVEAAADPAVDPHLDPTADRVDDLAEDVDARRTRDRAGGRRGC